MNRTEETYRNLEKQVEALLDGESDVVANMANTVSLLNETLGFFWIGFYRVVGDQLVLGPFSGPVACTRIANGKGVCGASWAQNETIVVPDVHEFPGHIACSALSKSEIVIPVRKNGKVEMVLDIDSDRVDEFDEIDRKGLEAIVRIFESHVA